MDPVTLLVGTLILQIRQPGGFEPRGGGGPEEVAAAMIQLFIQLLFAIPTIIGMWGVFTKAGKPGWAAIIPIYNVIVLLEVAEKPTWWLILYCCPIVNIIISILVTVEVASKFGQGAGFAIGMICLPFIFYPILGFGSAEYQGSSGRRRRRRRENEDDDYEDDDYDAPRGAR